MSQQESNTHFAGGSGGSPDSTHQAQAAQAAAAANDFRARFHRSIAAPTPFQTANSTPASAGSTTAPPEPTIDPHLAGANGTAGQSTNATTNGANKSEPVDPAW